MPSYSISRERRHVPFSRRPILPAAQNVHDEAEAALAGLDFPTSQVAHSLSALVSVRLLSRYVPAGQLAQGFAVAVTSSAPSYLVPAWQTLQRVRPLTSAKVQLGQGLHCVLLWQGIRKCVQYNYVS